MRNRKFDTGEGTARRPTENGLLDHYADDLGRNTKHRCIYQETFHTEDVADHEGLGMQMT